MCSSCRPVVRQRGRSIHNLSDRRWRPHSDIHRRARFPQPGSDSPVSLVNGPELSSNKPDFELISVRLDRSIAKAYYELCRDQCIEPADVARAMLQKWIKEGNLDWLKDESEPDKGSMPYLMVKDIAEGRWLPPSLRKAGTRARASRAPKGKR